MTITFRVDDGHDTLSIAPAIITPDQLGALRDRLAEGTRQIGTNLIIHDHVGPAENAFGFEARVCPLALATLAACFDHDPAAIKVLDEAQFRGRRVRIWKLDGSPDICLGLASSPDNAPEMDLTNNNAYALLQTLGLEPDDAGIIPISELRQRLTDPRIRRRLNDEPELEKYLPTLVQMATLKPIEGELHLAWA